MGFSSRAQIKIKDLTFSNLDRQFNGHFLLWWLPKTHATIDSVLKGHIKYRAKVRI